jgi:hypothetical protein
MREDGDGVASLGVRASRRAYRLNIVEIFFSILTRRMLRRGEFTSRQDLADKILKFIEVYNRTAEPFRWSYDAKLLKAA